MRPSASRKAAVCLRFSSRLISSIPCVRPSCVWNGMNDSGTNSVKPPVRSCSSRTTRMCSASSSGVSMWPNMTVTVERRPTRWAASMISTQRATGSLLGLIRCRTSSSSTSAAVPGTESRPASASRANDLARRQPLGVAHVRDLHRASTRAGGSAGRPPWPAAASRGSPRCPSRGGCRTACRSRSRRTRWRRGRGGRTPRGRARRRRASGGRRRSRRTRSRRCRRWRR